MTSFNQYHQKRRWDVMKKIFLVTLVLLVLGFSFVRAAADLSVTITPIKNTVTPVQNATYSMNIANNANKDYTLEFRYLDVDWAVVPDNLFIGAYTQKNLQLSLVPQPPYTDQKPQLIRLIVASLDQTFRNEYLLEINVLKYTDIIDQSDSNLIVPDPVDPRKPTVISVKITNTKDTSINNVNIKLVSPLVNQNKVITISPQDSQTYDFDVTLPKNTQYGIYPISAIVMLGDRILANYTTDMKIGNYANIGEEKSLKSGFLYDIIEISKTNNGNSVSNEIITRKFSLMQKLFTTSIPAPDSIDAKGSDYTYIWRLALKPGETKNVTIKTDYRLFTFFLVAFITIIIIVYIVTKRDLILNKKLVSIKKEADGTSTIKMSITVKNKGFSKLMNIKVMDRIPKIVELPHEFGTAHPKVVDRSNGAQLLWEIVTLSPGEERIFSYKARSKIQIIGKSTIPSAVAKYNKGNRSLTVNSNPEQLFS